MGWPKEKSGAGDELKLEAGKVAHIHLLAPEPIEVRTWFHRTENKALTLPENWPEVKGEKLRYGFPVFDYADRKIKAWWVSETTAMKIRKQLLNYGLPADQVDLKVSGEQQTRGRITWVEATPTVVPSQYKLELAAGQELPDLTPVYSTKEQIEALLAKPNPKQEEEDAEKAKGPASPAQLKFLEKLIDQKKIPQDAFHKLCGVAGVKTNGEFVPKGMTSGQVSKLIDMLKE